MCSRAPTDTCQQGMQVEKKSRNNAATTFCARCKQGMCTSCAGKHSTMSASKSHYVYTMGSPLKLQRWAMSERVECTQHAGKLVKIYCQTCEVPGCLVCLKAHHGHDVQSLVTAANAKRQELIANKTLIYAMIKSTVKELEESGIASGNMDPRTYLHPSKGDTDPNQKNTTSRLTFVQANRPRTSNSVENELKQLRIERWKNLSLFCRAVISFADPFYLISFSDVLMDTLMDYREELPCRSFNEILQSLPGWVKHTKVCTKKSEVHVFSSTYI